MENDQNLPPLQHHHNRQKRQAEQEQAEIRTQRSSPIRRNFSFAQSVPSFFSVA